MGINRQHLLPAKFEKELRQIAFHETRKGMFVRVTAVRPPSGTGIYSTLVSVDGWVVGARTILRSGDQAKRTKMPHVETVEFSITTNENRTADKRATLYMGGTHAFTNTNMDGPEYTHIIVVEKLPDEHRMMFEAELRDAKKPKITPETYVHIPGFSPTAAGGLMSSWVNNKLATEISFDEVMTGMEVQIVLPDPRDDDRVGTVVMVEAVTELGMERDIKSFTIRHQDIGSTSTYYKPGTKAGRKIKVYKLSPFGPQT